MPSIRHDQALRKFRTYLEVESGDAKSTSSCYTSCARIFFGWVGKQKKNWSEIGIEDAGRYFTHIKQRYRPTTANFHLKALKALYHWGELRGYVKGNPWQHIRRVKGDPVKRLTLSLEEVNRIECFDPGDDWYGQRNRALVLFLLSTGMRVTACTRVNLADLDFGEDRVRVLDKGGRTHWKPIVGEARTALLTWIEWWRPLRARSGETALWVGRFGNRVNGETIRGAVAWVRRSCSIEKPITPHDLRRTPGRLMRQAGVPKEDIQKYYGHRRLQTTEIYCDEDDERGLEVARESHPLVHTRKKQGVR